MAESSESASDWLSLDATEPFPDDLFRVPVPDALFGEMSAMSDSALRSLLALLHLSFRFDPAENEWIHSERWFARKDVEATSGLSDQGTRDGLADLEEEGWTQVDRSGRSHQHKLLAGVPDRRFTYVPTALLEAAPRIDSGTELRVVLAVLRCTWGWTTTRTDPETGRTLAEHDRWAQLSYGALAGATGRSETAVRDAAAALQGRWIERVRPGSGAYQYRFLPEAVMGEDFSFSGGIANDLPPDRQRGGRSSSSKESSTHRQRADSTKRDRRARSPSPEPAHAVLEDLPPEKRTVARKLANVGVWPRRIVEVLRRYASERIEANFQLYRRRAAEDVIHRPGAWLYRAITQGFAGYTTGTTADGRKAPRSKSTTGRSLPPLTDTTRVSGAVKDAYVDRGMPESAFHLCKPGSEKPYMYFDPEGDGPTRRV